MDDPKPRYSKRLVSVGQVPTRWFCYLSMSPVFCYSGRPLQGQSSPNAQGLLQSNHCNFISELQVHVRPVQYHISQSCITVPGLWGGSTEGGIVERSAVEQGCQTEESCGQLPLKYLDPFIDLNTWSSLWPTHGSRCGDNQHFAFMSKFFLLFLSKQTCCLQFCVPAELLFMFLRRVLKS